jgi:hypothetical protein
MEHPEQPLRILCTQAYNKALHSFYLPPYYTCSTEQIPPYTPTSPALSYHHADTELPVHLAEPSGWSSEGDIPRSPTPQIIRDHLACLWNRTPEYIPHWSARLAAKPYKSYKY